MDPYPIPGEEIAVLIHLVVMGRSSPEPDTWERSYAWRTIGRYEPYRLLKGRLMETLAITNGVAIFLFLTNQIVEIRVRARTRRYENQARISYSRVTSYVGLLAAHRARWEIGAVVEEKPLVVRRFGHRIGCPNEHLASGERRSSSCVKRIGRSRPYIFPSASESVFFSCSFRFRTVSPLIAQS